MQATLAEWYPWLKALHIISVIAWMAGMLYLPRLFVYHSEVAAGSAESERFKTMERRLLRAIINPAMIATWIFGLLLAEALQAWGELWFQIKFALLIAMSAMHGFLARWRKDFAADRNRHSGRFYRLMNEVPTLLMIGIVILVAVKPF